MTAPPPHFVEPPRGAVVEAVTRALAEDLTPLGDVTSALLSPTVMTTARFEARHAGVVAGCAVAEESFAQVDPDVDVRWFFRDGTRVDAGTVIGEVEGSLRSVLTAERTALNFLCHLSGVATLTRTFVDAAAAGGPAKVWDTRKTTPGLRTLQKAAVRAGGGRNHRGNLSDWVLLKDNHITGIGITEAVTRSHDLWPGRACHVECERLEQMDEAIAAGADAVLLDNMSPAEVAECVAHARRLEGETRRPVLIECSGEITLDTIGAYSATGVDQISIGRITKSAPVLDIGLDVSRSYDPALSDPAPTDPGEN